VSRLLVDTRALLWWLADDSSLSPAARDAIANPTNEPLVSAPSVWEIAIKRSLGSSRRPTIYRTGSPMRGSPVVASAVIERLPVVTTDARFAEYGVDVRW